MTKDFNPSGDKDGEIEVEEGEEVVVERMESDEWCQVRTLSGEVGAVPMSHLELVPEGPETSERRDIEGEAMMLSLSDGLGSEQIDAVTGLRPPLAPPSYPFPSHSTAEISIFLSSPSLFYPLL